MNSYMKHILRSLLIFICLIFVMTTSASAMSILAIPFSCFNPTQFTIADNFSNYRDTLIRYIVANSDMKDTDSIWSNEVIAGLEMIPIRYLVAFIDEGWFIDMVHFDEYYPEYYWASGMCSYKNKTIYFNDYFDKSSVIHEMGHFVDYYTNTRDLYSHDLFFEYQKSQELQDLMRDYSGTNEHEYMADIFKYWIIRGEEFQNQLKILAPNTYRIMRDVMSGAILNEDYNIKNISALFAA